MKCIYIGEKFYYESGSVMSSIYKEVDNHYERTDWGFVNVALRNGEEVNIKPASSDTIRFFEHELEERKAKKLQGEA